MRGSLLPGDLPGARTRRDVFDDLVTETLDHFDARWDDALAGIGVLVEEVPPLPGDGLDDPALDPSVLEDQGVPLSRVVERPHDTRGRPMPPILILYRRPLEVRAVDRADLADLVHDVLVEQLASLLGVSPDDLDPGFHGDG